MITAWLQENKIYRFQLSWGLAGCLTLLLLIGLMGPYSDGIKFAPDKGNFYYYWQLPERSQMAFITAWGFYLLHQVFNWWLITKAKALRPSYSGGLHPINVVGLLGNVFFILLHVLQTKIWYDGLAQTVSVLSSQFSVIFLLVMVLIMESPRRGLFFGRKVPISQLVITCLRRYHGYYFSWAIVYTFWYHPIELTQGHLLGLFYIFALMLQGSLMFTRFHTNRWWTFFLEVYVVFHGAMVAFLSADQGMSAVVMFGIGFATLLVVTQIHGLGLSRGIIRAVIFIYLTVVGLILYFDVVSFTVMLRVPGAEYTLVFVVIAVLWLSLIVAEKLKPPQ